MAMATASLSSCMSPATDETRKRGVYAQFMLDACAIVAGNYPGNS